MSLRLSLSTVGAPGQSEMLCRDTLSEKRKTTTKHPLFHILKNLFVLIYYINLIQFSVLLKYNIVALNMNKEFYVPLEKLK